MRLEIVAAITSLALAASAAAIAHRAAAEDAETLGHLSVAAKEYEAAWQEERAPELLVRLGIVRRKLREYVKAKEAFRGYLRAAPEGPLRDDVERQLAKLAILMEAQQEEAPQKPPDGSAAKRPPRKPAREEPTPPPASAQQPPAPARTPPAPAALALAAPAAPQLAAVAPLPASETAAVAPRRSPAAAFWLAGGAVVAGGAGAALWWSGARTARDLDARFAAGDLSAADAPRYARARNEGLAGRALVGAAVALAVSALVLWW